MDRRDFYFKQLVQEDELDAAFAAVENAIRNVAIDAAVFGLLDGGDTTQKSGTPDLSVDVAAGVAYDQDGQRVFWSALQNVEVDVDYLDVSTAVVGVGNERWVSVFVRFERDLSDPRIDGNGDPVFFVRTESFSFEVRQGAEAPIGTATKPSLLTDAVLVADVKLVNAQTQVLDANISATRAQDLISISGSPRSLSAQTYTEALSDLLGYYNNHVTGAADKHTATMVDYGGGAAWANGTTNPAATVEAQIDKIITDLNSTTTSSSGVRKLGAEAFSGATVTIPSGTLYSQLVALQSAANEDIAARTAWLGGRTNPATNVFAAVDKIITDLAVTTTSDDGAERIGAATSSGSPTSLATTSVRGQIDELLAAVNARGRIASTESISGAWTFDNLTLSSTNKVKLASRSLTRYVSCVPYDRFVLATWKAPHTNPFVAEQLALNTTELPFSCPVPHGNRITSIVMQINPADGHAALPASKPRFRLIQWDPATGTETDLATGTDAAPDNTTYDTRHNVTASGLTIDIDTTLYEYYISVRGESGANSILNLLVEAFKFTMTVDDMDDVPLY